MGKLERITVTVPEEMAKKLRSAVDGGGYASASEIVREALRDWNELNDPRPANTDEQIRAMLDRVREGPFYPAEEVFAELQVHMADEIEKAASEKAAEKAE